MPWVVVQITFLWCNSLWARLLQHNKSLQLVISRDPCHFWRRKQSIKTKEHKVYFVRKLLISNSRFALLFGSINYSSPFLSDHKEDEESFIAHSCSQAEGQFAWGKGLHAFNTTFEIFKAWIQRVLRTFVREFFENLITLRLVNDLVNIPSFHDFHSGILEKVLFNWRWDTTNGSHTCMRNREDNRGGLNRIKNGTESFKVLLIFN